MASSPEQLNGFLQDFENLRGERFELTKKMLHEASSTDQLLADMANICAILYLNNRMRREPKPGFKSTSGK